MCLRFFYESNNISQFENAHFECKDFLKILLKGIKKQINFLVDEDLTPGENGTHVKWVIGVISMLYYCFENFGPVKKECHLHYDNASGQIDEIPRTRLKLFCC